MNLLKNISVYRLTISILIALYFNNIYIYFLLFVILLIHKYKESILFIVILLLIFLISLINTTYIPIGIVEKSVEKYYICDSLLYKSKIYTDNLEIGDVIIIKNAHRIKTITDLKKNILFESKDYRTISNISIRNRIYKKVLNQNDDIRKILLKFLYNITDYDDLSFNLGYGIAIYYLLKIVYKKNKNISLLILLIYSILFYFDPKFYLLILDCVFNKKENNLCYKTIFILIINKYLLFNYSLLIPLLIELYLKLDTTIEFNFYIGIIESLLFGSINLIYSFLYRIIVITQIVLLIMSLIVLGIPSIKNIYLFIIKGYEYINNLNFEIRGSITIFGLILYFLFTRIFKIKNSYLKYSIYISIILTTLNNPFLDISFIDVGQGDSILISLPFRQGNILIDTGSSYNYYKLKKYLLKKSIYEIDYLIITHNDSDHNGNIKNLIKNFRVKEIIENGKDIVLNKIRLKNLFIDNFDNDNDNSLVYWCEINDISFLFTGDISSKAERKLLNKFGNIDVDVLKVSHHGSKTGSSDLFISNILPAFSIISTSGQYNHPSGEVIKRLNEYLSKTYTTKMDGNIEFKFNILINLLKTSNGDFVIIK